MNSVKDILNMAGFGEQNYCMNCDREILPEDNLCQFHANIENVFDWDANE